VLRRAASEEEARKIFAQAEAALDTEKELPVSAELCELPGRSGCSARNTSRTAPNATNFPM
jgi:hypothetical protein